MPIADLVTKYMLTASDVDGHPFHPAVTTYANSRVTPLIDGYAYFQSLINAVSDLASPPARQAIYIASWAFQPNFMLRFTDGSPSERLIELLERKANEGADVRVLIWVSDFLMSSGFAPAKPPVDLGQLLAPIARVTKVDIQRANLKAIAELRAKPGLGARVIANALNDPAGAVHTKLALVFDDTTAVGFTGGMDPVEDRYSSPLHAPGHTDGKDHSWHDVMGKVEGDAVQPMFSFFRSMWNTLAAPATTATASPEFRFTDLETNRLVSLIGTPVASTMISDRTLPADATAVALEMRVQSLRTIPRPTIEPIFGNQLTMDGAGAGIYESEQALRKAIAAADTYIYVEDQQMEGSVLFSSLRTAIKAKPNLKLIMLTGQTDPADPAPAQRDQVLREFLTDSLQPSELDRVVFFEHQLAVVHSKLWLIDDRFAYIGSANVFNRGMFVEIEHGVSFVHEGADNRVEQLRRELWGEHFRLRPANPPDAGGRESLSLENGLAIWKPAWVPTATPGFVLPIYTSNDQEFLHKWIDGVTIPWTLINARCPSLCPLDLPLRDPSGGIATEQLGGHTYETWRAWNRRRAWKPIGSAAPTRVSQPAPEPFTALGNDFIDDPTLPFNDGTSGTPGLTGQWVMVMQSPTVWHIRKIVDHSDRRIFFAAVPFTPNAVTLEYGLLQPVLKPVPLPRPVSGIPMLPPWYFPVVDPKVDY